MDSFSLQELTASPQLHQLIPIAVGLLLLLAGRKLFWLALAVAGLSAGAVLGSRLPLELEPNMQLVVAVLCSLAGLVLALMVRRVGVPLAGLLAGGLGALQVAESFLSPPPAPWLTFLVGAVLGALVAALLVNGALIVASSVVGASTLVQPLPWTGTVAGLIFLGLTLFGIAVQARTWGTKKR